MSESVELLQSSPEPTSEPVAALEVAGTEQFFEASGPTTDGSLSDEDDSDDSFHSLVDDFQECGLQDCGAEAAFTAPPDRRKSSEATETERVGFDHESGGSVKRAAVNASSRLSAGDEVLVDTPSCSNQDTRKDELHPRLIEDQETVGSGSHPDHRVGEQGEGATEGASGSTDNITDHLLNFGKGCDDEGGGNNDSTRTDVDRSCDPSNSLINDPDFNRGSFDEGLVVEDEPLSHDEIDICCLTSVKAMDEECELKLKDRDTNLSQEELDAHTASAVSEKREGNLLFTAGLLRDAITRYNAGLRLCPLEAAQDRAMLFHNRAVSYDKMEERKLAVHSLSRALELDPQYCKALARRAGLHEALDNLDEALADYNVLLQLDPGHRLARAAVQRLPPMIEERNEKLKTEMLGKLKDLGNMFLRPFGLSTENFQMQQDPNSGGYNINFQQNSAN